MNALPAAEPGPVIEHADAPDWLAVGDLAGWYATDRVAAILWAARGLLCARSRTFPEGPST